MKCDDGRAFDPAIVVAFAPDDRFDEFSCATEHVGDDAAIAALLSCRDALSRAAELFNYPTAPQERWIDQQLGRLWKKRGPFPGIGAVLAAMGVPLANFVAQALQDMAGETGNPWEVWRNVLANPARHLPPELARRIDPTIAKAWQRLPAQRKSFLELLSRIDLTEDQAALLAVPEMRAEEGIDLEDEAYLRNPYLIYESTRLKSVQVGIGTVDRGVFPTDFIRKSFPLPDPSLVNTPVDARRLRALVIRDLEEAALPCILKSSAPQRILRVNPRFACTPALQDPRSRPTSSSHFGKPE